MPLPQTLGVLRSLAPKHGANMEQILPSKQCPEAAEFCFCLGQLLARFDGLRLTSPAELSPRLSSSPQTELKTAPLCGRLSDNQFAESPKPLSLVFFILRILAQQITSPKLGGLKVPRPLSCHRSHSPPSAKFYLQQHSQPQPSVSTKPNSS
ncbi:hypothetical protein FVEG_16261 [Fusarium verticillioides 7600]|uniref:Uncharacterized protein n=1 Tax=Gibberella moniliformis (strain M3125 / FGSC 7600) TaxID=334819 RepID=W7MBE2_GIBM7|nr:hypothetical protein FVEG_16261 [Fusarium verticillioides 7600]EWG48351.1 hypothetical protein FVEG_16261 [Fusarium verticillioides 7600]